MEGVQSPHVLPRNHAPQVEIESEGILDPHICWQAIYSRDSRFDGRFFAGATSTGLYCRNVCAVPFARPENTHLFTYAAEAESAGFRPCKRCRPQASPGTPAWLGTIAVVSRAVRMILEGALNEKSVEDLAERLGIGERQLRRLFAQHLGASPLKIATSQRLQEARKLIEKSRLPMTQIAFRAGFKSIREFNHAVRASTGRAPSELRHAAGASQSTSSPTGLELHLPYRPPFEWTSLISFMRERAIPGVELVSENSYQRTIEVFGVPGFLTVRNDEAKSRLIAYVQTTSLTGLAQTVERVRRIFDLNADSVQIGRHLSRDPRLRELLILRPGLRVPGTWDGFEASVLAILGQNLTTAGADGSITGLVQMFGTPVESPIRGLSHLFPQPKAFALPDLSKVGISDACANTLRKLASSIVQGNLNFATMKTLNLTVSRLRSACGVEESTANYIAMRAFGEPDAFPTRDPGLRLRLSQSNVSISPGQFLAIAEQWRPWRAYAAMHLTQ